MIASRTYHYFGSDRLTDRGRVVVCSWCGMERPEYDRNRPDSEMVCPYFSEVTR